jgi:valyl-tRNA synthetase
MALAPKYNPQEIEKKWYSHWKENGFFHSEVNEKPAYSIVIPPPNVTGVLHMGHMLNNTIQDVLVRRARLKGYNACWVPGTDHASIATEAKVVAKLKDQGIDKNDIGRDEFLKKAWDWTEEYGGKILNQMEKLGASCDWERTKFTLDDDMYESVIQTFIDLHEKGLIYRGFRMVNWDPEAKTTLSDEEVIYKEENGKLYYVHYPIKNSDEKLTIATTRPETIFGDTAICVNPEDERYKNLIGQKAIVPIVDREIPIVSDEYVDPEFGTGCLKITPAHSEADYEIGQKHDLESIDVFNDDATLNAFGLHYKGQDRFDARNGFAEELQEKGFMVKIEEHQNKVGTSERTKAVIEPKLSDQWFLKMKDLAEPALDAVMKDGSINLFPDKFKNTYRRWLEEIRDWNISRQLWWGHRIPAYYFGSQKDDFVVAKNGEEALKLAREKSGNQQLKAEDLRQDEDVLDTWFSSWIWPMSVFDGIRNPDNKEFQYYYPTTDLVTGPDILFFWVARMIMAGYEFTGKKPFSNVYLTGIVRDKQGRKMSKSLGNSPDALKLIDDYSADGVRVGLLLSNAAGNDLLFDEGLCQQGKAFGNKIWNAFRLIEGWERKEMKTPEATEKALEWFEASFQKSLTEIEDHFSKYRISDALMAIYKLVWDDFCSWLLEMIKPGYEQPIDENTYQRVIAMFENNLKLLHPFMPFLSEEIWHQISDRKTEDSLIVAEWPKQRDFDRQLVKNFEFTKDVVSGIRKLRADKNIAFKEAVSFEAINNENFTKDFDPIVQKLGNLESINYREDQLDQAMSFRVKSNEYFIPMQGTIDVDAEIEKLEEELEYNKGFLTKIDKKLQNKGFVNNAPEKVVQLEQQKRADAEAKIKAIEASLESLK